jgi:peptidyl-prolyl cis-trans isomerase B (cyclophilin B)
MTTVRLQTNHGAIDLELNGAATPKTVANFVQYVNDGHFSGTVFHRIIPRFMIQGGGFDTAGSQKSVRAPIDNEAVESKINGLKNDQYTVAMARTSDPHSATAQFFINTANNDFLNHTAPNSQGWGYCVFGKVVAGKEIVDALGKVRTASRGGHGDWPVDDVVIESASVI